MRMPPGGLRFRRVTITTKNKKQFVRGIAYPDKCALRVCYRAPEVDKISETEMSASAECVVRMKNDVLNMGVVTIRVEEYNGRKAFRGEEQ